MTVLVSGSGVVARWGIAVLLVGAMLCAAIPAGAASPRGQPGGHSGDAGVTDSGPYNVDPDPCGGARRRGHEDGAACGGPPRQFPRDHNRNGTQHPGPSAFGLQFNSDGY